jgi:hypothetical protein
MRDATVAAVFGSLRVSPTSNFIGRPSTPPFLLAWSAAYWMPAKIVCPPCARTPVTGIGTPITMGSPFGACARAPGVPASASVDSNAVALRLVSIVVSQVCY